MKHWAQFYVLRDGKYVEPVGDRQIIQLDGRYSRLQMKHAAGAACKKRGYDGYRLARGDNLLRLFFLNAAVQPISDEARTLYPLEDA